MSDAYCGGCACGAIRYEVTDEPIAQIDCQCRSCQHLSGTGHSSYLIFPDHKQVKLEGEGKVWQVAGDNGNVKSHAFCTTCGSPVYLTSSAAPGVFTIHAASLDDPSRYAPQAVTYNVSGYAWDQVDPALHKFERMPPR